MASNFIFHDQQNKDEAKFEDWSHEVSPTSSWFIPKGLQLTMKDKNDKEYGPFIGMMAYSPESVDEAFVKFKVEKMEEGICDASENIMICNGKYSNIFCFFLLCFTTSRD